MQRRRWSCGGAEGLEEVLALLAGGGQRRGEDRRGVGGVGLVWQERADDEAIDGVLDAPPSARERVCGQRVADLVQVDGLAEQVA